METPTDVDTNPHLLRIPARILCKKINAFLKHATTRGNMFISLKMRCIAICGAVHTTLHHGEGCELRKAALCECQRRECHQQRGSL